MVDFTTVLSTLQQGVQAINNLSQKVSNAFPQGGTATSTSATTGSAVLPSTTPAAFLDVTIGGTAYKIPLYNP